MTTPAQPSRARWRLALLMVLTALAALLLPAAHASASSLPAAETRVGASALAAPELVGVLSASPQVSTGFGARRSCRSWWATVLPQKQQERPSALLP